MDHVVPISQWRKYGVRRRVLDNDSNKVLACRACNEAKGCSDPRAWLDADPERRRRLIAEARYLSDAVKAILGLN